MDQKNMCPPPLPGTVPPPLPGTTVPPVLPKVKEAMEAKEREAKLKAKEDARRKAEAEAEAKAKAEEARRKAEAEAKAKRMVTPEMVINRIIKDLTEPICWTEKVKTGMFSSETRVHRYLKCSRPLTSFEMIVICTGEAKDPAEYDTKKLFIPANSKSDSSTPVFQCIRDLAKKYHEPFLKEKGASYPYFDHFDWNNIEHVKLICPQFDGMYRTGEEANHGCSDGPYYPILKLPQIKLG